MHLFRDKRFHYSNQKTQRKLEAEEIGQAVEVASLFQELVFDEETERRACGNFKKSALRASMSVDETLHSSGEAFFSGVYWLDLEVIL